MIMNSEEFRKQGKEIVDRIADYMETINENKVSSSVAPGQTRALLPTRAPVKGESFDDIMTDVERIVMPGLTHWQHSGFHAFYPTGNSYPSTLADMLSDGLGCLAFSWASSPSCTELEMVMTDWFGKMIGLPDFFLHESGKGGGVIQGSATECVLINILSARHRMLQRLQIKYPQEEESILLSKLVGYASSLVHSSFDKSAKLALIKTRKLPVDKDLSLRGSTLKEAIEKDIKDGLVPCIVCVTLGSTSCCSFDNLEEIGQLCYKNDIWLHVDAAYAGNGFILPEFRHYLKGIEFAFSINVNPCKMLLVHSDTSLMWIKDHDLLTSAMTVNPLYLQHKHQGHVVDYMNWGLMTTRRFRAMKLWFVIRTYGVEGLQNHTRKIIHLAKLFESKVLEDSRMEVVGKPCLGLSCFRIKGSNAMTKTLLEMINGSGNLLMSPAMVQENYVIRFVVCSKDADEKDIEFAWKEIAKFVAKLDQVPERLELRYGK